MTIAKAAPLSGAGVSKSIKQTAPKGKEGQEQEETTGLDAEKTSNEEKSSSVKAKIATLSAKQKDGIPSRVPNKEALSDLIATTERPSFGVEKSPSSGGSGSSAGGGQGGSGQQQSAQQQSPNFGNNPPNSFSGTGQGSGSNQANNGWLGQPNVQPPNNNHHGGGRHEPQNLDNLLSQGVARGAIDSMTQTRDGDHIDTRLTGVDPNLVGRISRGAQEAGLEVAVACKDGSCSIELSPHAANSIPNTQELNSTTNLDEQPQELVANNEPPPPPPEPQVQEAMA